MTTQMEMTLVPLVVVGEPNKNDPDGAERRTFLITHNVDLIREGYATGIKRDMKDPLIFVLDMTDGLAKTIHHATGHSLESQEKVIKECQEMGAIPTGYAVMPRWDAYRIMQVAQKELHRIDGRHPRISPAVETLANPAPKGYFWCVAISKGKQIVALAIE